MGFTRKIRAARVSHLRRCSGMFVQLLQLLQLFSPPPRLLTPRALAGRWGRAGEGSPRRSRVLERWRGRRAPAPGELKEASWGIQVESKHLLNSRRSWVCAEQGRVGGRRKEAAGEPTFTAANPILKESRRNVSASEVCRPGGGAWAERSARNQPFQISPSRAHPRLSARDSTRAPLPTRAWV